MNSITAEVSQHVLRIALGRSCPYSIPRSGEAGAKTNCFIVRIDDETSDPRWAVTGMSSSGELECLEVVGGHYSRQVVIPIRSVNPSRIRITHFYGLSEITFFGPWRFLFQRLFFWPYLGIHLGRSWEAVAQFLFNRRGLAVKQRINLLKKIIAYQEQGNSSFDVLELMTHMYSSRWVLHPKYEARMNSLTTYLDGFVDTGELSSNGQRYRVRGTAFNTIQVYEEQERRHREIVRLQICTIVVAAFVALLTVLQAGLIKVPPLLDLTNSSQASDKK